MTADFPIDPMDDYAEDDADWFPKCPRCHGSGLKWEGWPCEYCDGYGFLDF